MTLKLAQFCDDPKKLSTKSSYPKKILIFLKTPKNIEIQNFEPKKWSESTYVLKYQSTPLGYNPLLKLFKRFWSIAYLGHTG